MRKRTKKRKKNEKKDRIVVSVSGRPAMILERLHKLAGGKRSYADIIGDMTKNVETPLEQLNKAIDGVIDVCSTYFDSDTAKTVELFRPVITQTAKGVYDSKAIGKAIVELIESQTERIQVQPTQPTHALSMLENTENKDTDVRRMCAISNYGLGTPKSKRATPEISEKELEKRAEAKRRRIHEGMKHKPHDPLDNLPKFKAREELVY